MREGVPSLRGGALVREFKRSLSEASERGDFRVAHSLRTGWRRHGLVDPSEVPGAAAARS